MLESKNIYLRAIDLKDADIIRSWRNDSDADKWFFSYQNISLQMQEDWIKNLSNKKDEINWVICKKGMTNPIGTLALINIDNRNRFAEYARLIIDEKFRSKGFAYEAETLIIEYAFNYLNLNKIWCQTYVDNKAVIDLHIKTGFKIIGIFKKHIYRVGNYIDVNIMEILREDYEHGV